MKLGQIVHKTVSHQTHHEKRDGGVAQRAGPEFKPQYCPPPKKSINTCAKSPGLLSHHTYIQLPLVSC
jgi:hypothetical protein